MMELKLVLIILAFGASTVASLKCYTCTEFLGKNSNCENDVDKVTVSPCLSKNICARYVINRLGNETLHRGCYRQDICTTMKKQSNENKTVRDCSTCEKDLCNVAEVNRTQLTTLQMFVAIFAVILFLQ